MSYKLIILPNAEIDLAEQFNWYEQQKNGLGYQFLTEIQYTFRQIEENPMRHAEIYRSVRRGLVRRFPFKVFYLVEGENVEVIAVVHARRDPQGWRRRMP